MDQPQRLTVSPEEAWERFMARLAEVQPLAKRTEEQPRHQMFLGSAAAYRKVFLEANATND